MASWEYRFEELFAEIEGIPSQREIRKVALETLVMEHLSILAQEGSVSSIDIEDIIAFYDSINFYEKF